MAAVTAFGKFDKIGHAARSFDKSPGRIKAAQTEVYGFRLGLGPRCGSMNRSLLIWKHLGLSWYVCCGMASIICSNTQEESRLHEAQPKTFDALFRDGRIW